MGTHPIFESDFDCLTDFVRTLPLKMIDPQIDDLEFESDSDEVGSDLDMDQIPEDREQEDSDEELRVALATGLIQPGSTVNIVAPKRKERINNVEALKQKLEILKNGLDWTERLDVTVNIHAEEGDDGNALKDTDDFEREKYFTSIAVEGARIGVIKAKRAKLPLLRPDDFFAEMVKSDEHMGKVKANLLTQKSNIEKREKARQMRHQKKFAKDVQRDAKLKKQEERRMAKEEIKFVKKKGEKGLKKIFNDQDGEDFMKNTLGVQKKSMKKGGQANNTKRQMKNSKFGFGGKKDKRNNADSHFGGPQKRGPGAKGVRGKQKRPGKNARAAAKK